MNDDVDKIIPVGSLFLAMSTLLSQALVSTLLPKFQIIFVT